MRPRSSALAALAGAVIAAAGSAGAQVVRDGTLGPGTAVQPSGPNYLISEQMGARPGNGPNLFHSFRTFSLGDTPAGRESAHFQTGVGVENILARVTGGARSDIDGKLGADASLYLMNPAGIVFGPNATLDVNGSFHATTADYIKLGQGESFEAVPASSELLSVAAPQAFGFLSGGPTASADISVRGSRLELQAQGPAGSPSLDLVGRKAEVVAADDAATVLRAEEGTIRLKSVGPGAVEVSVAIPPEILAWESAWEQSGRHPLPEGVPPTPDPPLDGSVLLRSGRIVLENASVRSETGPDIFGPSPGVLELRADRLLFAGGNSSISTILPSGGRAGSKIRLVGPALRLENTSVTTGSSEESRGAVKTAGIEIFAGSLWLDHSTISDFARFEPVEGGRIFVRTTGAVDLRRGTIGSAVQCCKPTPVQVESDSAVLMEDGSAIFSNAMDDSSGIDLLIEAPRLEMHGGSFISGYAVTNFDNVIDVKVRDLIDIEGTSPTRPFLQGGQLSNTGIFLRTSMVDFGSSLRIDSPRALLRITNGGAVASLGLPTESGGGAPLTIDVARIELEDGGHIAQFRDGPTSGGDRGITITAHDAVSISGATSTIETGSSNGPSFSVVIASPELVIDGGSITTTNERGSGGDIVFSGHRLEMREGGRISSLAGGERGGAIDLTANDVRLASRSSVSADSVLGGDAGEVKLNVGRLTMEDAASISTSNNSGHGRAGRIAVSAAGLVALTDAVIASSTDGRTDAGAIIITANGPISLSDSRLSSSTGDRGDGKAGEITLRAPVIEMADGASISTRSEGTGRAGRIELNASDKVQLVSSTITTEALNSFGGSISINGDSISKTTDGRLVGIKRSDQAPGFLMDLVNSSITASVGAGEGDGGNIFIDPVFLVLQNSPITATAKGGNGGNILIRADFVFADRPLEELLNASSEKGVSGTVLLSAAEANIVSSVTALPARFLDATALLRQRCAQRGGKGTGSFVVAGTSGIAPSPDAPLAARGGETQPASVGQVQPAGLVITQDGDGHSVGLVVTCESEFGSS